MVQRETNSGSASGSRKALVLNHGPARQHRTSTSIPSKSLNAVIIEVPLPFGAAASGSRTIDKPAGPRQLEQSRAVLSYAWRPNEKAWALF